MSDRRLVERFWQLPVWLVLKVHGGLQERRARDTNLDQQLQAQIAAIAVNALSAFGKEKSDPVEPRSFLPFDLEETESSASKELEKAIAPDTARAVLRAARSRVPVAPRAIAVIKNFPELWKAIQRVGDR